MTIESNLARIADALERIATLLTAPVLTNTVAVTPTPTAPVPPAATPPAPPAATPAAAPVPPATMTLEQLNQLLVVEFTRLGNNRQPIDAAIKALGANTLSDLNPALYPQLLANVQAVAA